MGIFDGVINRLANSLAARLIGDSGKALATVRNYRIGVQSPQLHVRAGQFDDNIVLNYVAPLANRIVSQVMGHGIEFDFEGDTESESEKFVKAALKANHEEVLFHRAALAGVESGTGYLFVQPDGITGEDGELYPRVTLLDSAFVTIQTLPEDFEAVTSYTIQYKFIDAAGKDAARRRVVKRTDITFDDNDAQSGGDTWEIVDYISDGANGGRWVEVGRVAWEYPFAPILHWQNLPSIDRAEGEPDITHDIIALQDRINFYSSNASKIIRFYAHPQRYSRFLGDGGKVKLAPDEMPNFTDANGGLFQLEPMGDMAGILANIQLLRKAMFDRARVVDVDSMQDKLGALTNFGLRVLYQDNINLINTHRELLGDALEELARRLLILAGKPVVPCKVVWPDWMPVNEVEEIAAIVQDINAGLLSRQTAAGIRGYDWEQEQERIAEEKAGEGDIGTTILNAFNVTGQ